MDATIPSLREILAPVPDPRKARGRRHPWPAVLLLVVVGLLSGANSQRAVARWGQDAPEQWRRGLGCTRLRGPSQPTLQRRLGKVAVGPLETVRGDWLPQGRAAWRHSTARWLDGIAIDGKTRRGARRLGARDAHLLSACCQRFGVVLGEVAVPDSTNEAGAVGALLDALVLAGETVTFDAAFTQYLVAQQVVRQGGAYFMLVQGNQPTLLADGRTAPAWPARQLGTARAVRVAHGRPPARCCGSSAASSTRPPGGSSATRRSRGHVPPARARGPGGLAPPLAGSLDHGESAPLGSRRGLWRRPGHDPHRARLPGPRRAPEPRHLAAPPEVEPGDHGGAPAFRHPPVRPVPRAQPRSTRTLNQPLRLAQG